MVNVVTDNATNFAKAFSLFHTEVTEQSESPDGSQSGDGDHDNHIGEDVPLRGITAEGNVTEALDNFDGESDLPSEEDIAYFRRVVIKMGHKAESTLL